MTILISTLARFCDNFSVKINQQKHHKSVNILIKKTWQKILIITGIALSTNGIYTYNAQAKSITDNLVIAQNLGGIIRQISLEEIPISAMSAAKTVSGAQFQSARAEVKSDGSLIYYIRGKNQQGFEVEVQSNSVGNILQVDEQIEPSAVPDNIVKILKKWAADAKVISTWRSTRLGAFYYQFVIQDYWLEIASDGNKINIYRRVF